MDQRLKIKFSFWTCRNSSYLLHRNVDSVCVCVMCVAILKWQKSDFGITENRTTASTKCAYHKRAHYTMHNIYIGGYYVPMLTCIFCAPRHPNTKWHSCVCAFSYVSFCVIEFELNLTFGVISIEMSAALTLSLSLSLSSPCVFRCCFYRSILPLLNGQYYYYYLLLFA